MSSSGISNPGVLLRRSACNRCRRHKLRCPWEGRDPDRCDRCLRANASCVTGPSERMGRPPRADAAGLVGVETGKRGGGRNQAHEGTKRRVRDSSSNLTALATSSERHPSADFAWDQTNNSDVYDIRFSDGFQDSFVSLEGAMEFDNISGHQEDFYTTSLENPPIPALTSTPEFSHLSTLGPHIVEDPGCEFGWLQSTSETNLLGPGHYREIESVSMPRAISHTENNRHAGKVTESCAQRLSNLSSKLSLQLSCIDAGPPTITLDTLVSPCDENRSSKPIPIEIILNCTQEFLEILKHLKTQSQSSHGSPWADISPPISANSSHDSPRRSNTNTPLGRHSIPDSTGKLVSNQRSPLANNSHLETGTLLLITACYVYIIRLYVVVFAHVLPFLTKIAATDDHFICPVPDISVSHFSLESGNLQAMVFIQITTNLLGNIESLLGLPLEYRLNRRGDDHNGLLSDEDFAKIVLIAIKREESGSPETGKGGIKALRNYVKKSEKLLKESIAL